MESAHLSPADVIKVQGILKSQNVIPIHFGTFKLGDDGYTEPIDELKKELDKSDLKLKSVFHILDFGESRSF
jgi:L-ascorbate metabolism protein UlaG (beta-lactamase superfamily)